MPARFKEHCLMTPRKARRRGSEATPGAAGLCGCVCVCGWMMALGEMS